MNRRSFFYFPPRQLERALQRVREEHPSPLSALRSEQISTSETIARLIKRLLTTSNNDLPELMRGLSPLEERLFCGLLHHESKEVQVKALYGLRIRPQLAPARMVWAYLEQVYPGPLLPPLAQILLALHEGQRASLHPAQVAFCRAIQGGAGTELGAFWHALLEDNRAAQEFQEPTLFTDGSPLAQALERYIYHQGSYPLWSQLPRDEFLRRFQGLSPEDGVTTLIHGWRLALFVKEIDPEPFWVSHFLSYLGPSDSPRWTYLKAKNSRAAAWYHDQLISRELHSFFDGLGYNDRFEFWKNYTHLIRNLRADPEYLRLFMDFGRFGVIEFGEVGNATYIYDKEDYQEFLELNFRRRPRSHSRLKSRARALDTLNHNRGWQARFDFELKKLFRS